MNQYETHESTWKQPLGRGFGRGYKGAVFRPGVNQPVGCLQTMWVKPRGRGFSGKDSMECLMMNSSDECICDRPRTDILCKNCSHIIQKGRLFRNCKKHPSVLYLMDIKNCPSCGTTCDNMIELP